MNAYITIRDSRGDNRTARYTLIITVAHSAWNEVVLTWDEAQTLINAGVPVTQS